MRTHTSKTIGYTRLFRIFLAIAIYLACPLLEGLAQTSALVLSTVLLGAATAQIGLFLICTCMLHKKNRWQHFLHYLACTTSLALVKKTRKKAERKIDHLDQVSQAWDQALAQISEEKLWILIPEKTLKGEVNGEDAQCALKALQEAVAIARQLKPCRDLMYTYGPAPTKLFLEHVDAGRYDEAMELCRYCQSLDKLGEDCAKAGIEVEWKQLGNPVYQENLRQAFRDRQENLRQAELDERESLRQALHDKEEARQRKNQLDGLELRISQARNVPGMRTSLNQLLERARQTASGKPHDFRMAVHAVETALKKAKSQT